VYRLLALFIAILALSASAGWAQPRPNAPALSLPAFGPGPLPGAAPPPVAAPSLPPAPPGHVGLFLSASFAGDNKPIRSGLVWRVFEDRGEAAKPGLVAQSTNPAPNFNLPPGNYVVHVAYGYAGASKRLTVQSGSIAERLTISAGALKLGGSVADQPIPANRISFAVYVPIGANSEGRLVISNAKAGDIIRLPDGTYHVVSTYGDSNAIMRADLKVETGRVTEATLNHRAATVTLKLVANEGGEAFAGTAFSVLTPGGDVIREAIGAFPALTLAEGDYTVIARHEGQVYTREFKVQSGLNRDIEVLAKR
jgi:hypothetical protein